MKKIPKFLYFTLVFIWGFFIGALATYWSLTTLMKARATIAWMQGIEYIREKEYDMAIGVLNKAVALYPKDYLFYSTLAEAYERKGNYEMALYEYECALSLCLKDSKDSGICKYIEKKLNRLRMQIKSESKD